MVAGSVKPEGYRTICILGRNWYAHRLAWLYVHGYVPPELLVDHEDQSRDHNWISNLRLASRKQNAENTGARIDNTSGAKGVSWCSSSFRWEAKIQHLGRTVHLGKFPSVPEASAAYQAAAAEYFTHYTES